MVSSAAFPPTSAAFALLALSAVLPGSSTLVPGFSECIFNDHRYRIGETFHPTVRVNGQEREYICHLCTCQPTTIVLCEMIECPALDCLSEPVRIDGECCPICIQPDITPTGPKSCLVGDIEFKHGDRFHPPELVQQYEEAASSNTTNTTTNPYCIECLCNNGEAECEDQSSECPAIRCNESEAFIPSGGCCKQCPLRPAPPGAKCQDFDGQYYAEGETWHPTLPGEGIVPCINCTCTNSTAVCSRPPPCPEVPLCGPNDTVETLVLCCPKCSIASPLDSNITVNITPPVLVPCDTPYTYKVYKHDLWDCMALENTDTNMVDVYKWLETDTGNMNRTTWQVSSGDFEQQSQYQEFTLVGWVRHRRVRGLYGKESKRRKIEQCTQDCAQLVVNMLRPVPKAETYVCN